MVFRRSASDTRSNLPPIATYFFVFLACGGSGSSQQQEEMDSPTVAPSHLRSAPMNQYRRNMSTSRMDVWHRRNLSGMATDSYSRFLKLCKACASRDPAIGENDDDNSFGASAHVRRRPLAVSDLRRDNRIISCGKWSPTVQLHRQRRTAARERRFKTINGVTRQHELRHRYGRSIC